MDRIAKADDQVVEKEEKEKAAVDVSNPDIKAENYIHILNSNPIIKLDLEKPRVDNLSNHGDDL